MESDVQQQEFTGALHALGGSTGNGKLRELLGWDEAHYEAIKAALINSGQISTGRGRGGSVALCNSSSSSSFVGTPSTNTSSETHRMTVAASTPVPQPSGK